ncbi:hypothetical protein [Nocardia cyriacigeorgica]|uniref:hypothetical protein n=1 Tax=Nocardia cyriacigeorgica TaxID=135487 RepID=UPI002457EFC4|nr:hypothetical protein [Nocardia cyriacigeorgica]
MSADQYRVASDQHRADAVRQMRHARDSYSSSDAQQFRAAAQVHALLAIEARLAELVEQQKIANALAITGSLSVLDSEPELLSVRRAARKLLGLDRQQEGRPE